jgi:phosphonopyruvate decarboxylase
MISTPHVTNCLKNSQFAPFIAVPCSVLKPLINFAIDQKGLDYIAANNEGEGVAIAAGAWLAGKKPVVMFQNSGLGNAVSPITSLSKIYHIPMLLIITWRGMPNTKDAPQYSLMGKITPDLLKLMEVENALFPLEESQATEAINRASEYIEKKRQPYALTLKKGIIDDYPLEGINKISLGKNGQVLPSAQEGKSRPLRRELI